MSTDRRISIIIPCWNDAVLLDRCLQALHAQQVRPDEIIVVDNGSTDDSAAVAHAHGARVLSEPRPGITWATQTGLHAATGDVLARIDADVAPAPDYLARLHDTWDAAERSQHQGGRKVVGVTGSGRFEIPGWRGDLLSRLYLGAYQATAGLALGHYSFFGTNYSIKREWWLEIAPAVDFSDTEVHEDMHLSFAVRPTETIWWQPDLILDMDARALRGVRQLRRRFRRGFHTVFTNWRTQLPQERLKERGVLPAPLAKLVR